MLSHKTIYSCFLCCFRFSFPVSGFLTFSMNSKSVLADILALLQFHLQERHKKSCQISDTLQKTVGSDYSSKGGSLLNSQRIESVSDLNHTLKLNERSPLLDAALSIMGYQVPQICDATTIFLIDTLTSILQSTITCKMLSKSSCNAVQKSQNEANTSHCMFDMTGPNKEQNWLADVVVYRQQLSSKQQFLQIGTVISANDFSKIVKACKAIFGNLQAYGSHSKLLIDKLLRVATSISSFQGQFPLSCRVYKKVEKEKSSLVDLFNLSAKEEDIIDLKFNSSTRILRTTFGWPQITRMALSTSSFEAGYVESFIGSCEKAIVTCEE